MSKILESKKITNSFNECSISFGLIFKVSVKGL